MGDGIGGAVITILTNNAFELLVSHTRKDNQEQYGKVEKIIMSKIDDPELVLIFCTPIQAEILIRAQSYLGSMVHGFGGNGGCIFNIRYSFVTRKPSFSTSDVAWRMFIGLNGNELTVTYPYEKFVAAAPHFKPINDYINNMTTMMNNTSSKYD